MHGKFFLPSDSSYVNGFQAYLAIALFVDLPPEDVRPAVWKRLDDEIMVRRKGHIHAGITGGAFLYKTLLGADRQDLLFAMANKTDYPSWGDMLRKGATTIYESWDMDNSWCHSSYLYIGTWFIEGLAGIKTDPQTPGFKRFILKPGLVNDPSLEVGQGPPRLHLRPDREQLDHRRQADADLERHGPAEHDGDVVSADRRCKDRHRKRSTALGGQRREAGRDSAGPVDARTPARHLRVQVELGGPRQIVRNSEGHDSEGLWGQGTMGSELD